MNVEVKNKGCAYACMNLLIVDSFSSSKNVCLEPLMISLLFQWNVHENIAKLKLKYGLPYLLEKTVIICKNIYFKFQKVPSGADYQSFFQTASRLSLYLSHKHTKHIQDIYFLIFYDMAMF